jgi:hypothetical protein
LDWLMASGPYYVKPTGNNALDGLTDATAWATLAKVRSSIPSMTEGAKVYLKRDCVWQNELLYANSTYSPGTAANPFIIGAYGTGAKPIITGSIDGVAASWANMGSNIWRTLCTSIDVGNVIVNTKSGTQAVCHKYFHSADARTGATPKMPSDILPSVQGNYFHNTEGINYYSSTSPYLYMYSVGNPSTFYDGLELAQDDMQSNIVNARYITLQDLDFRYNSDMGCMLVGGGSNASYNHHQIVERCDFSFGGGSIGTGTATAVRDGYGIQLANGGDDITVRDCTFDEMWNLPFTIQTNDFNRIYVYRNLFMRSGAVFESWLNGHNLDSCYWVNNTHYNQGYGLMWTERKTFYDTTKISEVMHWYKPASATYSNCVLKNNIYYGDNAFFHRLQTVSPTWDLTGWDIDYNCYYPTTYQTNKPISDNGTYRSMAEWQAGACCTPSPDANAITDDPLFTDAANGDFTLSSPTSPCIDAGVAVVGINTEDPPDMGAYETEPAPPAPAGVPRLCLFRKA